LEKDYKKEVASGYASSGIDAIKDTQYEGVSAWKGGNSPYRKNFPNI
jgi:hypothetical protein